MNMLVRVHRGYRLRPYQGVIQASYLRSQANPHLPRSFLWNDSARIGDLYRYIDALAMGRNRTWVRRMERCGLVQADANIPPTLTAATRPRIRVGMDWLLDVLAGRDRMVVPVHASLALRSGRDGFDGASQHAALIAAGLIPADLSDRLSRPPSPQPTTPMRILMPPRPWAAGAWVPLPLAEDSVLIDGFRVRLRHGFALATRLVAWHPDHPRRMRWRCLTPAAVPGDLARLLARSHAGFSADLQTEGAVEDQELDWIEVDARRLAHVLLLCDPLQIRASPGWLTVRWHGGHLMPSVIPASLVDRALLPVQRHALLARQRLGLTEEPAWPIPRGAVPCDADPITEAARDPCGWASRTPRSGSTLLADIESRIRSDQERVAQGHPESMTLLEPWRCQTAGAYDEGLARARCRERGDGWLRIISRDGCYLYLLWSSTGAEPWEILAEHPAAPEVCGQTGL